MAYLLQHLLSETASSFGDKAAVKSAGKSITYTDLEANSDLLASTLCGLGVGRGDRVAIYIERGIASITALFGVLKAGAGYVPIDPTSPANRLSYILDECEIQCVLTSSARLNSLESVLSVSSSLRNILVIDGAGSARTHASVNVMDWNEHRPQVPCGAPDVYATDQDIAFVLFTSGSTGRPKGVMLTHLNALTFVKSVQCVFGITSYDNCSNICALHFDMSVFDIFVAISAGATIVVIPEAAAMFPIKIAEAIAEYRITVWNSVPSVLSQLVTRTNLSDHDLSSLRLLVFAGELFPLKYLAQLQDALPRAEFCNMYGQTEANSSTYYRVDRRKRADMASLPIGKPMPNFDVFALDDQGNPVTQPGETGELYVKSSTVALGYWGDPDKTRQAFVRNPLQPDSNQFVYKTGDLVRLDPEGNWVFVSRIDLMIKSRGYRVEIGEIEALLAEHPDIENAVVVPIPDELVGNRISVVVVPSTSESLTKGDVVIFCKDRLPRYMVPEFVEFRESLPTTSSGKVDRKQLVNRDKE